MIEKHCNFSGLLGYGHSQNFDAAQEAKLIGKLDLRKHTIMFGLDIGGTKLILMEAVKTGTLITGNSKSYQSSASFCLRAVTNAFH